MALKFGGIDFSRGAELPVSQMSPHKHWEMWMCGKADHLPNGPFDRRPSVHPSAAPALLPEASAQAAAPSSSDTVSDDELERLTAPVMFTKAPGETVTFDPPPPVPKHGRRR